MNRNLQYLTVSEAWSNEALANMFGTTATLRGSEPAASLERAALTEPGAFFSPSFVGSQLGGIFNPEYRPTGVADQNPATAPSTTRRFDPLGITSWLHDTEQRIVDAVPNIVLVILGILIIAISLLKM